MVPLSFFGLSLAKEDSLGLGQLASLWCRFEGRVWWCGVLLGSPLRGHFCIYLLLNFLQTMSCGCAAAFPYP